jgi:hypothetical protein
MTCAICLLQPTRLCRSRRTLSAVPLFSQLRPFKVLCRILPVRLERLPIPPERVLPRVGDAHTLRVRLPKRLQDVLALRRVLFFGERASELCDPLCVLFEAFGQQPVDLGVGVRLQLVVVDLFLLLFDAFQPTHDLFFRHHVLETIYPERAVEGGEVCVEGEGGLRGIMFGGHFFLLRGGSVFAALKSDWKRYN